MNDKLYQLLVRIIDWNYWGGELIDEGNLPSHGPAVFVANHLGPNGPIGAVCSIPFRLYPWIIGNMVDPKQAAEYLRLDFVEKTLKFKPPFSIKIANSLSKITVPFLSGLGCVPVYDDYENLQTTLSISVSLLKENKCLLIFPENPKGEMNPTYQMTPFKKGSARLGKLYYAETGKRLAFCPVAVHSSRKVMIGEPIFYNPLTTPAQEMLRIRDYLEKNIHKMYLDLEMGFFTGIPLHP